MILQDPSDCFDSLMMSMVRDADQVRASVALVYCVSWHCFAIDHALFVVLLVVVVQKMDGLDK